MTGSSSNHTVRLYREGEKQWHCGVKGCLNEATHVCSYEYVTGQTGRASHTDLNRCREHAQKFRRKHDATYISRLVE